MDSLERSYDFCRAVAKSRAKNFYYSFLVLPAEKRRAMCAVYAFMRYCDDIVDEEAGETGTDGATGETGTATETSDAGTADRQSLLKVCREILDSAYDGDDSAFGGTPGGTPAGDGMLLAFSDTVRRFDIPRAYFDAIIDGAEMDLTVTRYATFADLYQYCYRVASAVGLVCIRIFGYRGEEAERYAESCGIAFQLTNILRDIREDAGMGRVYLPQEDLDAFGYPEENLRNGLFNDPFRRLMGFQVERARSFYDEALPLLPLVQPSSRACLATMIGIYRACLEEIPRRQYDVYSQRIGLSPWKKLSITARALIRKRV
ncbi:MAG: squalene/phytoene synthase family protein [Gemmatimonadetes bacterium]|nr:squalene/phytoene synthase family protein [Gemmatimonadota bacterium]MYD26721.1 squalene/phytoene synthase family protein [Gemmatimonadota bacterium]MYI99229.1 squalene/phytoene synthase family protein [Gemmatimonadota bacterium]